jgi:hypothetical protein
VADTGTWLGFGWPGAVQIRVSRARPWRRARSKARSEAIDTRVLQAQTIAVRWILSILEAIALTPWWVHVRRQRNRREMREPLRRYYANSQEHLAARRGPS